MRVVVVVLCLLLFASPAAPGTLRVMVYDTALSGKGPGLLLRDLERDGERPRAVAKIIALHPPDVLLLTGVDHDRDGQTLTALAAFLDRHGLAFPFRYSGPQNQGLPSGADLDGDGRADGPDDDIGFARFPGADGMAILTRHPIATDVVRSWTRLPWAVVPDAAMPLQANRAPFFPTSIGDVLPVAARGLWAVPIDAPCGRLTLLFGYGPPPIYDGPEDRNGKRGGAHARFWRALIAGAGLADDAGDARPLNTGAFVLGGNFGIDPGRGEGDRAAMRALLAAPALARWAPHGRMGEATADYRIGPMRTDYLLVSAGLTVTGGGVDWPDPESAAGRIAATAGHHRPLWADIACPLPN